MASGHTVLWNSLTPFKINWGSIWGGGATREKAGTPLGGAPLASRKDHIRTPISEINGGPKDAGSGTVKKLQNSEETPERFGLGCGFTEFRGSWGGGGCSGGSRSQDQAQDRGESVIAQIIASSQWKWTPPPVRQHPFRDM